MGTQHFPLNHITHQEEIFKNFQELLRDETFVDATLVCEGISIKAHRVVLSASSPFFQKLFVENPCNHPIVIMKDVKYKNMKGIVDFMYCGTIVDFNASADELSEFFKTAEMLNVKGLLDMVNTNNFYITTCNTQQEKTSKDSSDCVRHQSPYHQTCSYSAKQENAHPTDNSEISDFMTVDVSNADSEPEIEAEVKQEPESNHSVSISTCNVHFASEDTVSSVCYEGTFVSETVTKDNNRNSDITSDGSVKVTSTCQKEFAAEAMPQFSDIMSEYGKLSSAQNSSAESLGVIIRDSPPPILHFTDRSLERSTLADHHDNAFSQCTAPAADLKLSDEPNAYSGSSQLHPAYIPTDSFDPGTLEENILRSKEGNGSIQRERTTSSNGREIVRKNLITMEGLNKNESQIISHNALYKSQGKEQTVSGNKNENSIVVQHCTDRSSIACELCHKEFSTPFSLARHRTSAHTGERPFVCEACGKNFARKDNFRAHQRIHTGTQPHICSICKKRFITTSHLRAHLYTHLLVKM